MRQAARVMLMTSMLYAFISVAGCAHRSPNVSFYTLTPQAAATGNAVQVADKPVSVIVGPADFPRALRRAQLATRSGPNKIEFDQFNRWAGSLDSDFLGTVGSNLSALLGSNRIAVYPNVPVFAVDYQVSFEVQRFDSDADGLVTLETRWVLQAGDTAAAVYVGQFNDTRMAASTDPSATVAAHSELVAALSQDIAAQIRQDVAGP
ncbi:MAG: PqiC family protein [Gammaproteobacteria bacterium]